MAMDGLTLAIEKYKKEMGYKTYIETIVEFVEIHGLDFYDVVDQIDPILKKKVQTEFIKLNYFPDKKIEGTLDDFLGGD